LISQESGQIREPASAQTFKVLYGVSSVGLGHVRRSLSIAEKLRSMRPNVKLEIDFISAEPALSFLKKSGENVLPISSSLESLSYFMERDSKAGRISDMSKVASESEEGAKRNYRMIRSLLKNYDILIQDEFVETLFAFMWDKYPEVPQKRVVMTDYVRLETESPNPLSKLKLGYANRMLKKAYMNQQLRIFLDTPDALPQSGEMRKWIAGNFHVLGPVMEDIVPTETREDLINKFFGRTEAKFIVFNLGGTSVGKPLAQFVIKNANILSEKLDSYLIVLLGPRISPSDLREIKSTRISLIPFSFDTLKYFKIADCVVTQAGASSLYEIATIGVPCVIMPISNHFEQKQNAERFANRYGFQILEYEELGLPTLQKAIVNAISQKKYEPMRPTAAAQSAAKLIHILLDPSLQHNSAENTFLVKASQNRGLAHVQRQTEDYKPRPIISNFKD
jgi:predicted glycosyltransferase